MKARDSNM